MSTSAAVLQMHDRPMFERNVTRALAVGAGAGVVAYAATQFGVGDALPYLAIAGTSLACVRGDKMDRLLLGALSIILPATPDGLHDLSSMWKVGLGAAAAGALMVKSRVCEKGDEGTVGSARPGLLNYGLAAPACGGLAVGG